LSRQIRKANVIEPLLGDDDVLNQLKRFLTSLHSKLADQQSADQSSSVADQVMKNVFGFVLERRDSRLPDLSGRGVFVKDGMVPSRNVVALYPGCVCTLYCVLCFLYIHCVSCMHVCVCACVCVCMCVCVCGVCVCMYTCNACFYYQR